MAGNVRLELRKARGGRQKIPGRLFEQAVNYRNARVIVQSLCNNSTFALLYMVDRRRDQ
jgi:hypothetical protein